MTVSVSPHEEIHLHNMLPDMELDETLGLTSRLGDRIQGMHDLIGLDNRILSEAERMNPNGIGRIYDDQAFPEEDDEFDELTANQRAIALLQHIKNNDSNLWKTVAELPDGIRSALPCRTDQSPGFNQPQQDQTIVMMATEDSTRCYAVGDDLAPTPIRPAQFVAAAECLPSTPPEPLPGNTNQRVNAAAELFQQDLTRILGTQRRRTGGNALNRRFIRRQLNGLLGGDSDPTKGGHIAPGIHRRPAHGIVENEITELRRLNLGGRELVVRLELLQERVSAEPIGKHRNRPYPATADSDCLFRWPGLKRLLCKTSARSL